MITLMLIDRFGSIAAFWMVAGGFLVIGLIAVAVKEHEEEVIKMLAASQDVTGISTGAVVQVSMQALMALLGALLSTPPRSGTLASGAKMVIRNIPLVALLALLTFLFRPSNTESDAAGPEDGLGRPNGMRSPVRDGLHGEAP